jgi:hypothetical protein
VWSASANCRLSPSVVPHMKLSGRNNLMLK